MNFNTQESNLNKQEFKFLNNNDANSFLGSGSILNDNSIAHKNKDKLSPESCKVNNRDTNYSYEQDSNKYSTNLKNAKNKENKNSKTENLNYVKFNNPILENINLNKYAFFFNFLILFLIFIEMKKRKTNLFINLSKF